jgi:hypothetical protein
MFGHPRKKSPEFIYEQTGPVFGDQALRVFLETSGVLKVVSSFGDVDRAAKQSDSLCMGCKALKLVYCDIARLQGTLATSADVEGRRWTRFASEIMESDGPREKSVIQPRPDIIIHKFARGVKVACCESAHGIAQVLIGSTCLL